MSEREQKAAAELLKNLKQIPASGADYIRGYVQGRIDGLEPEKEDDNDTDGD